MKIRIDEISRRLSDRAEAVVMHLLPSGRKSANCIECGSVNGEPGKTLKVNINGSFAGNWRDWNGQEQRGDLLDLWSAVRSIPLPMALAEAKTFLGISEPLPSEKTYTIPRDDKKPLSPDGVAMQWLVTERKIDPAIVNRFRIQGDGAKKAIVFPSYAPDGKLVNRSFRCLELDENGKKRVWQDKAAAPALFGWQSVSSAAYAKRTVLLCEGQIDAMTWAQWGIDALSIPNGSGQSWIEFEWQNLEAFTTILLSFDTDGKSDDNLNGVISRLGKHRCRVVSIPHKDANEALKAGATAADAAQWIEAAQYVNLKHLVTASHYAERVADEFFPSGAVMGFPIVQTKHYDREKEFRFRPAELTIWTGTSGHGKSSLLNHAMAQLAVAERRPALIVSLEMLPQKVIRRLILNMGLTPTTREEAIDAVSVMQDVMLFCDRVGKISREELMETLHYAFARYGIAHAAIDSLMRVKGLEEDYPAQNDFITDLVTFARETGVHVHLVAHPRKTTTGAAVAGEDIKGSGHIRDNADNVLSMWRNMEKERARENGEPLGAKPDAILYVEKDREEGIYRHFPLEFCPDKYSFRKWEEKKSDAYVAKNSRHAN